MISYNTASAGGGIHITYEDGGILERANKLLAGIPRGFQKATHSALKRAGETAKTKAGQFAAAEYMINKGTFMRHTDQKTVFSGNESGASVQVIFAGHPIPLIEFRFRFSRGGYAHATVKRGGGGGTIQKAFVTNYFGNIGAFERIGDPRFPIHQLYGPSTAQMMANPKVMETMDKTVKETFEKRMDHEILRVLNGWGK